LLKRAAGHKIVKDDDLAGLCEKMSLQNAFAEDEDAQEMQRERPAPPQESNTEGWTAYADEEGKLWHHYDGPLGEWWCRELNGEVLSYGN